MPRLSAALIVKNEERFLEGCLRSLVGVIDEVVVVDTGSDDQSKEIARSLGAHVHEYPWTGDFAAARNESLRLCHSDWILYIDADERVREGFGSGLNELLADTAKVGYYVRFHVRPGFSPYRELRIFRNDSLVRFQGVIHENIWPGIRSRQAERGGEIGECGLVLEHLGYEGDQRHKHQRNLPLLLESLEKDPDKVFNWCHLARVYEGLGEEQQAERAWRTGIEVVRRKEIIQPGDSFPYLGLIEWYMARETDATMLLEEAAELFPGNLQVTWNYGRQLMKSGHYEQAVPLFRELLGRDEEDLDLWVGYDRRLFGVLAYDSLATCYFRLDRHTEAERYYRMAADSEPDKQEYRLKQHICARLAASKQARPAV